MSDGYRRLREFYEDISGQAVIAAATTTLTLKTARNQDHALFIQKVHIRVTTLSASKTWTLADSASPAVPVTGAVPTDAIATFDLDFGAQGLQLTAGKNLVATLSAAGAAGTITWEGYTKPVTSFSMFVAK